MNLAGMTLAEQVEHLKWLVEELTTPPPELDGALECLTPQQQRIVGRLLRSEGQVVRHSALIAAASTHHTPDNAAMGEIVRQQIFKARRRLSENGVQIEIHACHGHGYRAVLV